MRIGVMNNTPEQDFTIKTLDDIATRKENEDLFVWKSGEDFDEGDVIWA